MTTTGLFDQSRIPYFLATEVTLLAFKPLFDGADIFRKKHIENLLLGNREKAEEYEKELNETLRSRIAKNGKQRFLGRFKKEDFNLSTIHNYVVGDIMGFN